MVPKSSNLTLYCLRETGVLSKNTLSLSIMNQDSLPATLLHLIGTATEPGGRDAIRLGGRGDPVRRGCGRRRRGARGPRGTKTATVGTVPRQLRLQLQRGALQRWRHRQLRIQEPDSKEQIAQICKLKNCIGKSNASCSSCAAASAVEVCSLWAG